MSHAPRISRLPLAAMLLAAAVSYLGLPQIVSLCRANVGGMAVLRVMDSVTALKLVQRLETLAPDSPLAAELKSDLASGAETLRMIGAVPQFLGTPAPALARSSLSYVPPRPTPDGPAYLGALAALSCMPLPQSTRPPPLAGPASFQDLVASQFCRAAQPVRAPPVALR